MKRIDTMIGTVKQEMAEIIFNAEFVKTEYAGNSCKNIKKQINTDEMVDYYERKEACDYTVGKRTLSNFLACIQICT